jgi:hypothetical protein
VTVLPAFWIKPFRDAPMSIVLAGFVAVAALAASPQNLLEAFSYARPISPLLLWLMVESVIRRKWQGAIASVVLAIASLPSPVADLLRAIAR